MKATRLTILYWLKSLLLRHNNNDNNDNNNSKFIDQPSNSLLTTSFVTYSFAYQLILQNQGIL